MTQPLAPPKRKDPLKKTRAPLLPPGARSRTAQGLAAAAAEGRFALQVCGECGTVVYPPPLVPVMISRRRASSNDLMPVRLSATPTSILVVKRPR